ncbi:MAG TPA: pitrilysin family protein [Xanthobacteraceae bacterium]
MTASWKGFAARLAVAGGLMAFALPSFAATAIERVISPRGIEAWLVRAPGVPLIALDFAFRGGSNQNPPGKAGVANMAASLLDEGAGDLDARAFHEQLESHAIGLSFAAGRDHFSGSLRTLPEHQDKAFDMLRLALGAPRFEAEALERIRSQVLSGLRRATTNPNAIATRRWWATAFPGHPYEWPVTGTLETVPTISQADLSSYVRRVFARDNLRIGIVGNVDAATAGAIVDRVFGELPEKADLVAVAPVSPRGLGRRVLVDLDVPQTVVMIGGSGIPRHDPDFMAAYIVNHILGGGSFSSRLYREVREARGLAYSVYSTLVPLDHAALFMGGTATRADRAGQTLDVVEREIRRLAETGPSEDELARAKSYLKGSYPLRFDTSSKIAGHLVQIQLEDLGIDYVTRRTSLIDAVTLADVTRVAKRLLEGGLLVTMVGRPPGNGSPNKSE